MTRLRTCEGCARHVFVTEARCPFCQRELAPLSRSPIFDIRANMSRAQRVALVAAAVAGQTLLGCSDESGSGLQTGTGGAQGSTDGTSMQGSGGNGTNGTGMPGTGGEQASGSGGGFQAMYGGAPPEPGTGGAGDEGTGGQMAVTHYGGIMPPEDAGTTDAGDAGASDAGQDGGRAQALYGAAIPPYGAPFPGK